jgi:hypothetical protein
MWSKALHRNKLLTSDFPDPFQTIRLPIVSAKSKLVSLSLSVIVQKILVHGHHKNFGHKTSDPSVQYYTTYNTPPL